MKWCTRLFRSRTSSFRSFCVVSKSSADIRKLIFILNEMMLSGASGSATSSCSPLVTYVPSSVPTNVPRVLFAASAMRSAWFDSRGDPDAEISWCATMAFISFSYCRRRKRQRPSIRCTSRCKVCSSSSMGWIGKPVIEGLTVLAIARSRRTDRSCQSSRRRARTDPMTVVQHFPVAEGSGRDLLWCSCA